MPSAAEDLGLQCFSGDELYDFFALELGKTVENSLHLRQNHFL